MNKSKEKPIMFDIEGEFRKAVQYHQTGDLQQAEAIYKKILPLVSIPGQRIVEQGFEIRENVQSEFSAVLCYRLGMIACQKKDYDTGIHWLRKAVQIKADFADAYYNMGGALFFQNKTEDAILCWQKAVEFQPDYAEAYFHIGKALSSLGKSDEAIECFRKTVKIRPDHAPAYYHIANALTLQNKTGESVLYYRRALEINPQYAEAYYIHFIF